MRFREHRGGLAEAMQTMVELPDRAALEKHCRHLLHLYEVEFPSSAIHVEPYFMRPDTRIGWAETYIVWIDNHGVIGFTDEAAQVNS